MNALRLSAVLLAVSAVAATPALQARGKSEPTACERNFDVQGSLSSGRTYSTEADVPGATYPDALYRARDKLVEQGLDVIAVQEKNGYIRANNAVRGGQGGSANAALRGYVTRVDDSTVNVSLQFTISGGQMANRKTLMKYMCEVVEATAGG